VGPETTLERAQPDPTVKPSPGEPPGSRRRRAGRWLLSPPGLATLATVLFIAISVAWVLYDERVPDWDMGRHLGHLFDLREQILGGSPFAWWNFEGDVYPPVFYLVGLAGTFVGGVNVDAPIIALNAVGVPLLAVGCYRVASIAFDRWAGVLAVLFALGGPMVISQFHVFSMDMVQVGLVAASVWLLLETERFSRPGMSILAGLLTGAALLTKQSSAFFIAPLVVVLLVRGWRRDWRSAAQAQVARPLTRLIGCLTLFAGTALLVALPWYLKHSERLGELAAASTAQGETPGVTRAARFSFENFTWYAWSLITHKLFLPLTLFFAIGLVYAIVTWLRRRGRAGYEPELIAGALGAYLITVLWFGLNDARYLMPALVYWAALGAGWIVRVRRPIRIAATAVLVSVFAINTSAVNLGFPGTVRVPAPEWFTEDRELNVVQNYGYVVGPAHKGGEVLDLMRAAAEDGVEVVAHQESSVWLNETGLGLLARLASVDFAAGPTGILGRYDETRYNPLLLGERAIFLLHLPPWAESPPPYEATDRIVATGQRRVPARNLPLAQWPEPCREMYDYVADGLEGGGLYVFRGVPFEIDRSRNLIGPRVENLYCPLPG
jgi:hypothetical protein